MILACLVPLLGGGFGVLHGMQNADIAADNHYRYLSGLLFGLGLGFLSGVPHIEHHGARFRLLTFVVVVGGLGRLLGVLIAGMPGNAMLAALAMELLVTPLLCLWQHRLAVRMVK